MAMTEEEIRDMEQRKAWEDAGRVAQKRLDDERGTTEDTRTASAPEPPAPVVSTPPDPPEPDPGRPVSKEELDAYGATPQEQNVALDNPTGPAPPPPTREPTSFERITEEEAAAEAGVKAPAPEEGGASALSGGGSGGSPGGMLPFTQQRSVKYGKPVAPGVREAMGQAGQLRMEGAEKERAANEALHQHEQALAMAKVAAGEKAMAEQQKLAAERDSMVSSRMAHIEMLNKEAQGRPEDLWSTPQTLSRLTGFLLLTLGAATTVAGGKGGLAPGISMMMSGKFINGLIDQDIQNKANLRKQSGEAAGREINLLHLHEEQLGDRKKAIEATKLAYYDNILHQMEAYKAEHAGAINEANFQNLQAQILKQQAETANNLGLQESATVTDELVNKRVAPTGGEGAGGGVKDIPHQIKLSDGTTFALPTEAIHKETLKHLTYLQEIQALDNEAIRVRGRLSKLNPITDREEYMALKGDLERIQKDHLDVTSVAHDQGVVNAADRRAEDAMGTSLTSGYGYVQSAGHGIPGYGTMTDQERNAADATIRAEVKRKDAQQRRILAAAGAKVVTSGYNRNPNTGELAPVARYEGRDSAPAPALAPAGSRPRNGVKDLPTAPARPASETTPRAPILSQRPTNLPAPAAHHRKKTE